MIPAMAFFTVSMIVFEPIIPEVIIERLGGTFDISGQSFFLLLLLTVLLGFTLTSLNTFTYKVFEGYVLLWRIPYLRKNEIKRARSRKRIEKTLNRRISRLENSWSSKAIQKRNVLISQRDQLITEYDHDFPFSEKEFMPTQFGNILKAAEAYPRTRYQIDAVPIWPRLIHVVPEEYFSKVDQLSNQLSFLMNCTILALLFSCANFVASIYQYFLFRRISTGNTQPPLYFIDLIDNPKFYIQNAEIYIFIFLAALFVTIVFRKATILVIREYGDLIRSTYDLFRLNLIEHLKLEMPETLLDEIDLWEEICDFFNKGNPEELIDFKYHYKSESAS